MANSTASSVPPRALPANHFRLEEPDDRFGEGVVVRIAAAADRRLDAGVGQALGVAHREILAAAIAVMHQVADGVVAAVVDRLLERIEHEVGPQRRRDAPADDAAREDVDDERDVDEAAPRRDVREVRDPELIRPRRGEVPVDQVGRAVGRRVAAASSWSTPARARRRRSPSSRIRRRTRQRAARRPSRPICRQTLRGRRTT